MNKLADPSHPIGLPDLVDGVGGKRLHGSKDVGHHLLALGGHLDHLGALGGCLAPSQSSARS